MQPVLLFLLRVYQKTLSPDHSWLRARFPYGYCRYYPSCSAYAQQAITKHGSLRGVAMAVHRIARCNPWSRGGLDKP